MCVGGTNYTPLSHTIFSFCSQKEREKKKEKDGDKVERHNNSKVHNFCSTIFHIYMNSIQKKYKM